MLSVIMLNSIMLSVIMLNSIMLSVIMLSVIMPNGVLLCVVAPYTWMQDFTIFYYLLWSILRWPRPYVIKLFSPVIYEYS
jgi:hypothetical protein